MQVIGIRRPFTGTRPTEMDDWTARRSSRNYASFVIKKKIGLKDKYWADKIALG